MKNYRKLFFEMCLAGVWMALAWSLRGQFGHLHGALIPGACLALALSFLMKEEHWRESIGLALILGSAGFAAGGHIGYGVFFDAVAHASAFGQVKKEFWQLLGIGMVWGGLGATFLGFAFSEKKSDKLDYAVLGTVAWFWFALLGLLNFDSWDVLIYAIGLAVIHAYNFFYKKSSIVWMLALAGCIAWGAAFLFSAILLCAGYLGSFGQGWEWWVLRDQIIGFTAGALFWLMVSGLQTFRFRRQSVDMFLTEQRAGFFVLVLFIPLANAWDVIAYWLSVRSFDSMWPFIAACGVFLFLGACIILSKQDMDFLHPKLRRTLTSSVRFFLVCLILFAISKQHLVLGRHWEDAYTFFIVLFVALDIMITVQLKKLQ